MGSNPAKKHPPTSVFSPPDLFFFLIEFPGASQQVEPENTRTLFGKKIMSKMLHKKQRKNLPCHFPPVVFVVVLLKFSLHGEYKNIPNIYVKT
jgi:hypothetical protein